MRKWKKKVTEKRSFKLIVFSVLNLLVILSMIRLFMRGDFNGVLLCLLTLVLFLIPTLLNKRFDIELPDTLEIIVYLSIFSAEIMGEINEFYIHFKHWDTMVHTINGFIMAAIGFALVDILNKNDRFHITLSPIFVSLVAFCFSMTVGVVWELMEYSMDKMFDWDMQKDTFVTEIISVKFDENNANNAIKLPVESVEVNGKDWMEEYGGYLDIGLHDTMKDLFVNLLGAVMFSIIGWLYLKGNSKTAEKFIPRTKPKKNVA